MDRDRQLQSTVSAFFVKVPKTFAADNVTESSSAAAVNTENEHLESDDSDSGVTTAALSVSSIYRRWPVFECTSHRD